jgi:hypothetical protein
MSTLGKRIKEARIKRGLTQRQLESDAYIIKKQPISKLFGCVCLMFYIFNRCPCCYYSIY